jgi:hypothetical protein
MYWFTETDVWIQEYIKFRVAGWSMAHIPAFSLAITRVLYISIRKKTCISEKIASSAEMTMRATLRKGPRIEATSGIDSLMKSTIQVRFITSCRIYR